MVRRLLGLDEPQETRVFLFVAAFGLVIGVIYWFVSYEVAGTVLLLLFGVANGALAIALVRAPGARLVRRRATRDEGAPNIDPDRRDVGGGSGTGDVDRPFLDELGRLPGDSFAPFAVGLGAATAVTGVIFGPAPVVVGLLPFLWGAVAWLRGAGDELDATEAADAQAAQLRKEAASRGASRVVAEGSRPNLASYSQKSDGPSSD
jgi:hypothetical protein